MNDYNKLLEKAKEVLKMKNKKVLVAIIISVILYVCTILSMIKALGLEEGLIKGVLTLIFIIPATFYGVFIAKENEDSGIIDPLPCIRCFILFEATICVAFFAGSM